MLTMIGRERGLHTLSPNSQSLETVGHKPVLPPGVRIYAVGDIHGRHDLLEELLRQTSADIADRQIVKAIYVFLGDYIDRGPASRQTIDRLIQHGANSESIFLKGNHESLATRCLSDRGLFDHWMRLGGAETLASYGVALGPVVKGRPIAELQMAFHNALPADHLRFFGNLQTSYTCGDFFFVHAGVKPGIELSRQHEKDLLWIRDEFLNSQDDFGKTVVHGHTPVNEIEVKSNRINIDTGAFATGRLTCLVLEEGSLSFIRTG